MDSSSPNNSGFFGGLSDLITSMKNLVISANTINQTLTKVFPSWTAGQIPGTSTNGNATAGNIGEYISSTVLVGAPVSFTSSATPYNITSISLTGGDWDVWGSVGFVANSSTTATIFNGGINTTSATLPVSGGALHQETLSVAAGALEPYFPVGMIRVSLATTTSVYLVGQATFAVSTMGGYGFLAGRRVR